MPAHPASILGPIVGGSCRTLLALLFTFILLCTPALAQPPTAPISGTTAPPQATGTVPQLSTQEWITLGLYLAAPVILIILYIKGLLRPGGLKSGGVRQVTAHPWWMWLMAALLPLMAVVFGQSIAIQAFHITETSIESVKGAFIASACAYFPAVLTAIFLARLIHQTTPTAGLSPSKLDLPYGAAAIALTIPIVLAGAWVAERIYTQLLHQSMPNITHSTLQSITDHKDDPWAWGTAALAAIVAPILEELVYRGFLQSMLLRISGSPGVAILLSSAAFTAMHWKVVGEIWPPLVPLALLSLGMGIAFERSKRIGVPIVMHILFNAANIALAVYKP